MRKAGLERRALNAAIEAAAKGTGGSRPARDKHDQQERVAHSRQHALAEYLAGRLPPLLSAALKVASASAQGTHGRRRAGMGDAFWQYRPFLPGDAAGRIDWRRSARSDRLFLREREWEAAQTIHLWRSAAPGMNWRSADRLPTKRERAEILLLALGVMLGRGGERAAAWGERPGDPRQNLARLAEMLEAEEAGPLLPPSIPIARHAEAVLIGDFLAPLSEIEACLAALAGAGAKAHLLMIADPAEEELPYAGRVRFLPAGGHGEEMLAERVEPLRGEYRRCFAEHRRAVSDLASRLGFTFSYHRTDHPPETALLALHAGLGGW